MKIRRNLLGTGIIILSSAVLLILARGVSDTKGGREEKQDILQLRLWHPWAGENKVYGKYFLEAVEEYNARHPQIQVIAEGTEMELYREKLPSAIASNDTPDIYFCYAEEYLHNVVRSGKLLEMNHYLSPDLDKRIQMDSLENMSFEGGIYGLSFAKSMGVFLVNQSMFDQYGLDVPVNWEQLVTVCRAFVDQNCVPFVCSGDSDIGYRLYLEMICMRKAGEKGCRKVLEGMGEPADVSLFAAGAADFTELVSMGAFGKTAPPKSFHEVEAEFYLSRIPMYYTKSEFIGNVMLENNPLYGKIRAIPFPSDSEETSLSGGVSEAFVVNKDTPHPAEAVSALEEILREFSGKLYEKGAGIPTWNMDGKERPRGELLDQIYAMDREAGSYMQYWEFLLSGREAKRFMTSSDQLIAGILSSELFTEQLRN